MPVDICTDLRRGDAEYATASSFRTRVRHADPTSQTLTIGLVNNMPDAAFRATERQFVSLLESASSNITVRLCLYVFPEINRSESGARQAQHYSSIERLWATQLDGLIVTGREPLSKDLKQESYWNSFVKLVEWAKDHTESSIWSCLAAHAAVLHMDEINRRRNELKQFGIFDCMRVAEHPVIESAPAVFQIPHSRWNGLSEAEVTANGYTVLSRTADSELDLFVKQDKSLFVFFQGHPEYDSDTLLREYLRDAERYFRNESGIYPRTPRGYFTPTSEEILARFRMEALNSKDEGSLGDVVSIATRDAIANPWRRTAICIYKNWINYLLVQKHAPRCAQHELVV